MAGTNVQDLYGTEGSVPGQQAENGTGGRDFSVRASPDAFGANVGAAVTNAANQAQERIQQYGQIYTEAKVNDDYANGYVPAAAKLRAQYDQLPIQQKIGPGYDAYIDGLKNLNQQYSSAQPNIIGQKMMGTQINRHIAGEIDSTSRERTQGILSYSDQASAARAESVQNDAVDNYADPNARATGYASAEGHAVLTSMNAGVDHTTEDGKAAIGDRVDAQQGVLACRMASKAIADNNLPAALDIKREAGVKIPPAQYSLLDQQTDNMSLQQHAQQSVQAITNGQPIPHALGIPVAELRAMAVNDADKQGVDYNLSLATMFIESSNGTNLGNTARQSLGQDKESVGKSPAEQVTQMNKNLKEADGYAKVRFGPEAQPWQSYLYYQQGKPVTDALIDAAKNNPNANVVDVVQSAGTMDRKTAVAKVAGNHFDINGTAGDMLNSMQSTYQRKAALAMIDAPKQSPVPSAADNSSATSFIGTAEAAELPTDQIPQGKPISAEQAIGAKTPGEAIIAPHTATSPPVLPAANPMQALKNWNDRVPVMLDRIDSMPDPARREATRRIWEQHNEDIKRKAEAFTSNIKTSGYELAQDKDYTDTRQMNPTQAMYAMDNPAFNNYMTAAAQRNQDAKAGLDTKEMKTLGPKISDTIKDIRTGKLTDIQQLLDRYNTGDITLTGVDRANGILKQMGDSSTNNNQKLIQSTMDVLKKQVMTGEDGKIDPVGQDKWNQAYPALLDAVDQAGTDPAKVRALTQPESKEYLGNLIKGWVRPAQQQAMDLINSQKAAAEEANKPGFFSRIFGGDTASAAPAQNDKMKLLGDIEQETDPGKKAILIDQGARQGYWKTHNQNAPSAPISVQ